jgi:predicted nucleotidyltransferase
MAKGVLDGELCSEMVRLKKYFYALRPMLAAQWIADKGTVPPMDFESLRVLLPARLDTVVDELLSIKATVDEKFMIERKPALNSFLQELIRYCEARVPAASPNKDGAELNNFFKRSIA